MCHQPYPSFHSSQRRRRDRDWRSFQVLVELVPGFKKKISEENELLRTLYYTHVSQVMQSQLSVTHFFPPSLPLGLTLQEAMIHRVLNQRSLSG